MATLPGVFSPLTTLVARAVSALERNLRVAKAGSQAFSSTPNTDSFTLRAAFVLFTALTA